MNVTRENTPVRADPAHVKDAGPASAPLARGQGKEPSALAQRVNSSGLLRIRLSEGKKALSAHVSGWNCVYLREGSVSVSLWDIVYLHLALRFFLPVSHASVLRFSFHQHCDMLYKGR